MQVPTTEILLPSPVGIARAAALLRGGALVAFATETVYGLGADAGNDAAVARIFAAKGRPDFNPLIVHLADLAAAQAIAQFTPQAHALADAFWPGPLTLVLPLRSDAAISPLVTAGLASVAIRLPAHPVARALLGRVGRPVAAPSANPSGRISPTRAAHVLDSLSGRIEAVLDGGACSVGLESTIISLIDAPTLLRPGGITAAAAEAVLGSSLAAPGSNADRPAAPGQLASHYAPRKPLRLDTVTPAPHEVWIGFGPACPGAALNLSPSANLAEAAANLFHHLILADRMPPPAIAVAPIPGQGLGLAITDRLTRAAAPRP